MLNGYLIDSYRYLTNTSMIPLLIDPLLMLSWYYRCYSDTADTAVTYQYLVNSYIVKQYLTGPDQYSKIDSLNGSLYFNKTYIDGKWYVFRTVYLFCNIQLIECYMLYWWLSYSITVSNVIKGLYSGKPDLDMFKNMRQGFEHFENCKNGFFAIKW